MVSLSVLMTFCHQQDILPPEMVLEDSVLVNILADSYILNSAFNQTYGVLKDSVSRVYSQQILDKYQISEELLRANVDHLHRNPMRADTIFQRMIDRLNYLEERVRAN